MSGARGPRACLGAFAGAYGVKGETRVKTFTDAPENIAAYGPVESEDGGRRFTLEVVRVLTGGLVIARAPELKDREDAQNLKGVRLYVDRGSLPPTEEDEYYLDDLVGLKAFDETGAPAGTVAAVYNFGADDLIELKGAPGAKGARLIPFTRDAVPEVDIAGRRITVLRSAFEQEGDGARAE